ncbi:MAG: hypothetical protein ACOVMR_04185 [Flavobacteriales bacterium]|jgi:hypothetical protein
MNQKENSKSPITITVMAILTVYNILYWSSKFFIADVPRVFASFYLSVKEHWGLLTFLEFLAIASIFVDTISKFDVLQGRQKTIRIVASAFFICAFIARFLIGMIDLYLDGDVR